MTSLTDIIADIRNRIARLNVPDEPWVLQDGCSWRRIGTQHHRGPDGNVLRPYIAPDGHPDIAAAHGVLDYIIAVQPSNIAAVLDALEKAEVERAASKEEARMAWSSDEHQAVWAELKARAEAAEAALKEAVELLKPMAKSGADIDAFYEDQTGGQQPLGGDEAAEMLVLGYFQHVCTLGHLRAARCFIEAHTGGEDAE